MSRKDYIESTIALVVSYVCLGYLKISPYFVVLCLLVSFVVVSYQRKTKVEASSAVRSERLEKKIKTKTSDAYLKQKQLLTLVSNLPVPLVLLDEDGKVVLYNSYFEIFRKSTVEMDLSFHVNDFVEDVHDFIKDVYIFEREIDKTMNVYGIEYQAIGVPITTNSKYSGSVVLFQNINKAKEKEVLQKRFIADASHELKTPISAIKGMIEIINREDFDDEETRKEFSIQIEKETNRLSEIVMDLLDLSKLSSENIVLKRTMSDFTMIIDDCIQSNSLAANQKGIQIQKAFFSNELVFVDKGYMKMVVNNLLSNAIKYSDQGMITLTTKKENNAFIFEIKDEGKGLRKKDIDKIFERFYRADSARARNTGGSGLGLSIVKSIVDAHGANIFVESKVGLGTTFRIRLAKV